MILLAAMAAAASMVLPPPPPPPEIRSRAPAEVSVIDGSTLLIRTFRVVLAGVEGLERSQQCLVRGGYQPCGLAAQRRLTALVAGKDLACAIVTDGVRFSRSAESVLYGRCVVGGLDLSRTLAEDGLAVAIAGTSYAPLSIQACLAQRGAWAGSFEAPWTLRARLQGFPAPPRLLGLAGGTPCLKAVRPV